MEQRFTAFSKKTMMRANFQSPVLSRQKNGGPV
jgi:hypothetical protein